MLLECYINGKITYSMIDAEMKTTRHKITHLIVVVEITGRSNHVAISVYFVVNVKITLYYVMCVVMGVATIYCRFGNFRENFIFANSIKRHIRDVKNRQ